MTDGSHTVPNPVNAYTVGRIALDAGLTVEDFRRFFEITGTRHSPGRLNIQTSSDQILEPFLSFGLDRPGGGAGLHRSR